MLLQKNMTFYGISRSGNHAIIFWVINNLGGFTEMIRNKIYWNPDTQLYFYNHVNRRGFHDYFTEKFNHCIKSHENDPYIYNKNSFIILRDILNLLCSQHKRGVHSQAIAPKRVLQIWKQHAKHYALKHKDSEFNNIILYNNWVSDKAYRDEIGVNIGAPNIVDAIDYVSPIGNGSSFIKVQKEQDVEKYTTRYNQFKLPDEIIELILDDQEVLDLNQQIFNININDSL